MYSYVYQTPNKSIVLFCLIYLRGLFYFLKYGKKKNPVKTVTSPSSAPQVTFVQATRGVSNENGLCQAPDKQDTWHVSKRMFGTCISAMPC